MKLALIIFACSIAYLIIGVAIACIITSVQKFGEKVKGSYWAPDESALQNAVYLWLPCAVFYLLWHIIIFPNDIASDLSDMITRYRNRHKPETQSEE